MRVCGDRDAACFSLKNEFVDLSLQRAALPDCSSWIIVLIEIYSLTYVKPSHRCLCPTSTKSLGEEVAEQTTVFVEIRDVRVRSNRIV